MENIQSLVVIKEQLEGGRVRHILHGYFLQSFVIHREEETTGEACNGHYPDLNEMIDALELSDGKEAVAEFRKELRGMEQLAGVMFDSSKAEHLFTKERGSKFTRIFSAAKEFRLLDKLFCAAYQAKFKEYQL